jgi:hypothetical protein
LRLGEECWLRLVVLDVLELCEQVTKKGREEEDMFSYILFELDLAGKILFLISKQNFIFDF